MPASHDAARQVARTDASVLGRSSTVSEAAASEHIVNAPAILYPMFALALLTALVQVLIPVVRARAAIRGDVKIGDFEFGESSEVPPRVGIPNRNYMNLLEFPILLYVGCLMAYVATDVTPLMVTLAWAFVIARAAHSVIHLTYNRVSHRAIMFGVSNMLLVVLWVEVALHVRTAA